MATFRIRLSCLRSTIERKFGAQTMAFNSRIGVFILVLAACICSVHSSETKLLTLCNDSDLNSDICIKQNVSTQEVCEGHAASIHAVFRVKPSLLQTLCLSNVKVMTLNLEDEIIIGLQIQSYLYNDEVDKARWHVYETFDEEHIYFSLENKKVRSKDEFYARFLIEVGGDTYRYMTVPTVWFRITPREACSSPLNDAGPGMDSTRPSLTDNDVTSQPTSTATKINEIVTEELNAQTFNDQFERFLNMVEPLIFPLKLIFYMYILIKFPKVWDLYIAKLPGYKKISAFLENQWRCICQAVEHKLPSCCSSSSPPAESDADRAHTSIDMENTSRSQPAEPATTQPGSEPTCRSDLVQASHDEDAAEASARSGQEVATEETRLMTTDVRHRQSQRGQPNVTVSADDEPGAAAQARDK